MISISLVLNAAKKDVAGVVHAVQGENGARQLDIKICDADGAIMNLAEYTATFYVLKPDDTVVQTPMNVSGDTAKISLGRAKSPRNSPVSARRRKSCSAIFPS